MMGGVAIVVIGFGLFGLVLAGAVAGALAVSARDARRWGELAAALGFQRRPSPLYRRPAIFFGRRPYFHDELVGLRMGLEVRVGVRVSTTGVGDTRRRSSHTYVRVELPKELGLGLRLMPDSPGARLLRSAPSPSEVKLGVPAIDTHYHIQAADPQMAQRLLLTPQVLELITPDGGSFELMLTDMAARRECASRELDPAQVSRVVDSTVELARRLIAAREALGPGTLDRVMRSVWQPVALRTRLALDPGRRILAGRFEGMHVEARVEVVKTSYHTCFAVRFDRALGLGLSLTRQGALSAVTKLFGAQDVEVGDAEFDRRFVVRGAPEAAVRQLLSPAVRERLVELQDDASELEVKDDQLTARVTWLITEADGLERGVTSIARAGAAIAQVTAGGVGPFRG